MNIQAHTVLEGKEVISSKKHPLLPDFLVIGAGKSGTTSLNNYLKQHPQIFIPGFKEPNFFAYELAKPEDFKDNVEDLHHYKTSITNLKDYLDLYKNALPGQIIGETSNTYMYYEHSPARMKYYNPEVKLIAVLRQPAERLYSRFLHLARENRTPTNDFTDCLDRSTIWWKRNDLIKEGFYYKNLSRIYAMFPAENIKVFLYEEFNANPQQTLQEIYNFLGVDPSFEANSSIRYNQSGFIKNKFWNTLYGQRGLLINTVKKLLPHAIFRKLKNSMFLQKQLNTLRSKNLSRPKLDSGFLMKLTHDVYGEDIRQLEKLINRDLSHWVALKS